KSEVSEVPATTLSAVPRKSKLLAILRCIFKTDNRLLMGSTSTSKSFRMCDSGNTLGSFSVLSAISA
ncbi:hypothetical protein KR044_001178, partial [Drosophila immigrans]